HTLVEARVAVQVEHWADKRLRLADPPALLQVLESRDREDDAVRALEPLDQLRDLLVRRPVAEAPVDRLREHRDRERGRLRVDEPDAVVAELRRGALRRLERPRKLRREMERPDAGEAGRGKLLVGREKDGT